MNFKISFWRTKSGQEVDFVLGDAEVAIEVKGSSQVGGVDLRSLKIFNEEYAPKMSLVVSQEVKPRKIGQITILPWEVFFEEVMEWEDN